MVVRCAYPISGEQLPTTYVLDMKSNLELLDAEFFCSPNAVLHLHRFLTSTSSLDRCEPGISLISQRTTVLVQGAQRQPI